MIETKRTVGKAKHKWRDQTHRITSIKEIFFGAFDYRINGVVFTERSMAFQDAFDKHLTWQAISK